MAEIYTEEQLNSEYDYYSSYLTLKFAEYDSAVSREGKSAVISELAAVFAAHEQTISEQGEQLIEKDRIIDEQSAITIELQDTIAEKEDVIQSQQITLNSDTSLINYKDEIIADLRRINHEKNVLEANYEAVTVDEPRRKFEKISAQYKDLKDRYDEGQYRKIYLEKTRKDFVDNGDLQRKVDSLNKALAKSNKRFEDHKDVVRKRDYYKHQWELDEQKLARRDKRHEKDQALIAAYKSQTEEQAVEIYNLKADNKKLKNDLDYERKKGKHAGLTDRPASQDRPGEKDKSTNQYNHRTKTGKKRGGQSGHKKHTPQEVPDNKCDDVQKIVVSGYSLEGNNNDLLCPACGHSAHLTGNTKDHIIYDVKSIVTKRVETFYEGVCDDCGKVFYVDRPGKYGLANVQYGPIVKATILTMLNMNYTPINKIASYLAGITENRIVISQGYIAKLERDAARILIPFISKLEYFLTKSDVIHWDDTVVKVNKELACIRFYGNDRLKLYIAHFKKDVASIIDDHILTHLADGTIVSHDHWMGNYKDTLAALIGEIIQAECNIHLDRRFKKNAFDTQHEELTKIGEMIIQAMIDRRKLMAEGATSFSQEYIADFKEKISNLLCSAEEKNTYDSQHGSLNKKILKREKHLINDVRKFFDQYFGWLSNFKIPPDNNLSERALRTLKIRMKVSGQFKNIESAQNFAIVKSYMETCKCNGINVFYAFERLAEGNPLSLEEILNYGTTQPVQPAQQAQQAQQA